MVITKDGTTVTAKILNRFLGTISIYGSRLDEEGGREKENDLLKSEIDSEICSYLYNGLRWYHILYTDDSFFSGGFTMTSNKTYSVEYLDK